MSRPANRSPKRLRIVCHNVRVGRRPARVTKMLRRIIRRHRPHVILLQEAHGYIAALNDIPGYRLTVANGKGEARGTPILIRDNLTFRRRHAIRCELPWTGPKAGRRHRGRVFTVVNVEGWEIVNVHRTRPAWSHLGGAFAEEYQRLLTHASDTTGPLVMAGDQNIGTRPGRDRATHTPFALAAAIRGRIVGTTQGRVDYAIVRGCNGRARELGKYGSDHRAVLFVLTADK